MGSICTYLAGCKYQEYRGTDKTLARPERNKLQRQKVLSFIHAIHEHNWETIITIYIYVCICIYIYIYIYI